MFYNSVCVPVDLLQHGKLSLLIWLLW